MKKLFVLLCLSTSLAHAMNNQNHNALSQTSNSRIIIVGGQNESNSNNPDEDFFAILREIAENRRATAARKAQEQSKALLIQCATIAAGAFAVLAVLNNING